MPGDDTKRLNPKYVSNWETQSKRDLKFAETAQQSEFYKWACYLAQQAAEKAVKSVLFKLGIVPPYELKKHTILYLAGFIPRHLFQNTDYDQFADDCKELSAHVESARYPGIDGPHCPGEVYTQTAANIAIDQAKRITYTVENIKNQIP